MLRKLNFRAILYKKRQLQNIVKLAEIPRGSFYQYFENKEDLYFFITLRH